MDAEEPRKAAWIGSKEFARMLEDNRTAVEAANRETLKWTSFVTAVILTILFAASFIMRRQFIVPTYAVFAASSAAVYCFTRALGSKWESTFSILPVFYGYMYSLFALALCLAFYVKPGGTISTFIMLTIAFPLIVIDRPRTLIISFLLMDAVFCAYALKGYPASGAINSLVNCAVFSVGGLCLGRYICEIRLKAIEAQRQLSIQSRYDSLTGLGNRRRLFELLKSLESGGGKQTVNGIMMLDIDNFKWFNDTYGHQRGDDCLRQLGAAMAKFGRENGLEFFRYGGEEFIALCMSDGGETLCSLARELLLAVWEENIPFYTYEEGRVTLSIGYARAEPGDEDCEACIKRADQALYVAKGRGHNIAVDYRKCRNSVPFGGKTRFRSRK